MSLPDDFSKIFGSTATGGLTPISDVNYAKGWEFVGANPPEKNDFTYLQHLSDLKAQWLYNSVSISRHKTITANGSFIVPDNVTEIYISAVAAGGGGGSGGGGDNTYFGGGGGSGGAGESIIKRKFTVTPGAVINMTIGSGGTGSIGTTATGSVPTAGGNTVIGSLITLQGGQPGFNAANGQSTAPGGAGGQGYPNGSYGGDGNLTVGSAHGSPGASSPFGGGGGGGRAGTSQGTDGTAGAGYGSGGGSGGGKYGNATGAARGGNGGNGAPGIVIIEW